LSDGTLGYQLSDGTLGYLLSDGTLEKKTLRSERLHAGYLSDSALEPTKRCSAMVRYNRLHVIAISAEYVYMYIYIKFKERQSAGQVR